MNASPAIISAEGVEINIQQELEMVSIHFSEGIFDDVTIHDFLIEKLLTKQRPSALIIPASLGTLQTGYWGLRIGMHLRLTKKLEELRFIPLIFVSDDSLEEILVAQDEKLAVLCSTPGSILVSNNRNDINTALRILKPITLVDYKNKFLKAITINRPDSTGKHSLANVWGVSRLAQATGLQDVLLGREDIANRYKELYVKYLQSVNDIQVTSVAELPLPALVEIKAEDKRVLLIDDQADNGWADVLKPLFKGNLTCISGKDKSSDEFYDEAKTSVAKPIWDLILLDLRLDPKEDIEGNEYKMARQYSGAKLLEHIKKQNGGYQVIIFTASNKTWNLQELLYMGADGYYVKESPELAMSSSFSLFTFNSFADRVNICLEKNYLREAWMICESIKKPLTPINLTMIRVPNSIILHIEQGFNSLYQASSTRAEFYLYAFLDFYRVIEVLGKELIKENSSVGYTITSSRRTGSKATSFIKLSPLECEIKPTVLNDKPVDYSLAKYMPNKHEVQYYEKPKSSLRFCGLMLLRFNMTQIDTANFLRLNKLRNDLTHEGAAKVSITYHDVMDILYLLKRSFNEL